MTRRTVVSAAPGWRPVRHAACALAAGLAVSSCTPPDVEHRALVRDSLGVRITELPASPFLEGDTWAVSPNPLVAIGRADPRPGHELHRVSAARRLADGAIVVADGGSTQLRLFAPDGTFLRAFGGRGDGPGEFQTIDWVQAAHPDTLIVLDSTLRRFTAFTTDGRLAWTVTLPTVGYAWPGDFRLADGSFLLVLHAGDLFERARSGAIAPGGAHRSTAVLVRYRSDGTVADTLALLPGAEEAVTLVNGRLATTYAPWGRTIAHALSGSTVVVGTQDRSELTTWGPEGDLVALLRWPAANLGVGLEQLDAFHAALLVQAGGSAAAREAILERTASLPLPDAMPEHGRVLIDDTGAIWLSEPFTPVTEPARWSVIDPARGVVLGHVTLPEGFKLFEAGSDYVLGRTRDELGVESVVVLGLARGGA